MKNYLKLTLLGLLATGLLAACEEQGKDNETLFVPIEPELQEDYTETALGLSLEMVYVKGGEFMMGYTEDQGLNLPDSTIKKYTRKTKLDSYHIGKYEVTQAQWEAVMGTSLEDQWKSNSHDSPIPPSFRKGDNYPMYYVNWEEAQEFCKKLSEQTGKKYVLPTSAQWEYAARGGIHKTKTKYAGSNNIKEVAWYKENSMDLGEDHPDYGVHKVGAKMANALGIYDMSGNAWEWCSDAYDKDNEGYDKTDDYNPQGPNKGERWAWRINRGGDWSFYDVYCLVGVFFDGYCMSHSDSYGLAFGFRVVLLP